MARPDARRAGGELGAVRGEPRLRTTSGRALNICAVTVRSRWRRDTNGDGRLTLKELMDAATATADLQRAHTRLRWITSSIVILTLGFFGAMLGVMVG